MQLNQMKQQGKLNSSLPANCMLAPAGRRRRTLKHIQEHCRVGVAVQLGSHILTSICVGQKTYSAWSMAVASSPGPFLMEALSAEKRPGDEAINGSIELLVAVL